MNFREWLLVKLGEEAAEVAQRAAKYLQYGGHEQETGQPYTNRERLRQELNDLACIVHLCEENDLLVPQSIEAINAYGQAKLPRLYSYLELSRSLNRVKQNMEQGP